MAYRFQPHENREPGQRSLFEKLAAMLELSVLWEPRSVWTEPRVTGERAIVREP